MTVVARRLPQIPGSPHASDDKVIALTFDDAPGPNTAPVLDALAACGVPGTFFLVGKQIDAEPDLTRRIVAEGHAVGNHSWSHTRLEELGESAVTDEFTRTADRVREVTGATIRLARPPYTMTQAPRLATRLEPLGYTAVLGWSIDPRDWEGHDAMTITEHVVEELHPGAIVLLHAGSGTARATPAAITRIVQACRVLGYRFVTC